MTLTTDIAEAIKCAGSDPQVLAEIAVRVMHERRAEGFDAVRTTDREKLGDVITTLCAIHTKMNFANPQLSGAISNLKDIRRNTAGHAAQVKVKGLEWVTDEADRDIAIVARATNPITNFDYLVVTHGDDFVLWYAGRGLPDVYKTEVATKAAAQAHHKALVLSHIEGVEL